MDSVGGIHHVTAIAGDPQRNIDFYAGFLGLRLVKVTVNFDAPDTYHLYYGDELGRPGTLLTFFPQPRARLGRKGAGQASAVSFAIPPEAIRYWMDRFAARGLRYEGPIGRPAMRSGLPSERMALTFFDPDDLQVELVADPAAEVRPPWAEGPIPPQYALRGISGVTLIAEALSPTADFLTGQLGFQALGEEPNHRHRFAVQNEGIWNYVDLLALPGIGPGLMGQGAIHHIAWRAPDEGGQAAWRRQLLSAGLAVTPVLDRKYFRSIYFREPGHVLFEIATDLPGFTVDEPVERLGTALRLPAQLEAQQAVIERALPPLQLPAPLPSTTEQITKR